MITRTRIRLAQAPRTRGDADSRLVPLINIVFLMLIFFMLAGTVRPADPVMLERPVADTAGRQSAGAVRIVMAGPELYIDSTSIEPAALTAALQTRWAAGRPGDIRAIEIHADRHLAFVRLAPVLAAIRAAQADSVRLVTQRAR
ncbi:MAG: biopolymer transporter ExbD [Burkholderiaceae bacterium]